MALEDRPVQHGAATDARISSALPLNRASQTRPSPSRERRTTSSRSGGQSGDGSEFPRYLMQLGHDAKRTRAYEMIQELQLMVCNKDGGIKGAAARARMMVLLKEVQGVLIGLENKLDAQTFDLGVASVERSELRKELRDEKAKEQVPFHTVDFRNTEVKDLPHRLRTLFEDNQLLREQVRQLQYMVRSSEAKLEAAQRRNGALELEMAGLSVALREAGSSPDLAAELRRLRDSARSSEARALQLEGQVVLLLQQMEADRSAVAAAARAQAARQAALEERLRSALGTAAAARLGGGGGSSGSVGTGGGGGGSGSSVGGSVRKSSARSGLTDGWDMGQWQLHGEEDSRGGGGAGGRAAGGSGRMAEPYGSSEYLTDADAGPFGGGGADGGGGGGGGTIGGESRSSRYFRNSGYSPGSSVGGGGGAGAGSSRGRAGSGRDHSPSSPPRSPVGRSLSHSPGSSIPALYPLFNAKPRPTHAYSADASTWHSPGSTTPGGSTSFYGGGGGGSFIAADGVPPLLQFPPPPPAQMQRDLSGGSSVGGGGGGAAASPSRPHSSGQYAPGPSGGLEALQDAGGRGTRSLSATSRDTTGPGEALRAINSAATVTSRTLLPSVSGGSNHGGNGGGGLVGAGGGGSAGSVGSAGGASRSSGLGILSLRVSMGTGSGSGSSSGTGSGGVRRPSSGLGGGGGAGGGGLQLLGVESRSEGSGTPRGSAREGSFPAGVELAARAEVSSTEGSAALLALGHDAASREGRTSQA